MSENNPGHLRGKIAIVTGGGRGLGRAMALALAAAGAGVIITAARELGEIGFVASEAAEGRIIPIMADVTNPDDCESVVQAAVDAFGHLDILVNNAGRGMKYVSEDFLTQPSRFWQTDPTTWQMVVDTNVNGPFFMARSAVPVMLKGCWGRIINVSMNRETMRRAGFSPYGPSKAALESETVIWAQDLSGTGVTVNAILPGGATLTGMIPGSVSDDVRSKLFGPEVIVPPLMWLTSEVANGVTSMRFDATRWKAGLRDGDVVAQYGESL